MANKFRLTLVGEVFLKFANCHRALDCECNQGLAAVIVPNEHIENWFHLLLF